MNVPFQDGRQVLASADLQLTRARNACGVNSQLDRLQQQLIPADQLPQLYAQNLASHNFRQLQNVINSLSITSQTQSFLSANQLVGLLSDLSRQQWAASLQVEAEEHVSQYLWLIAAKASVQASGLVMNSLLQRTLQLQDEIAYWDEALGSMWYSGLYAVQTSPLRLWHWAREEYYATSARSIPAGSFSWSIAARWAQFYQFARQSIGAMPDRSFYLHLTSPIRLRRSEIRRKKRALSALKDLHTSSLGLLMEGWQSFQAEDFIPGNPRRSHRQWQSTISRLITLTEVILSQMTSTSGTTAFEQEVLATVGRDTAKAQTQFSNSLSALDQDPSRLLRQLVNVLQQYLPNYRSSATELVNDYGRPSGVVRYWLPVSVAFLSSSVSLRFFFSRQQDIMRWIVDIGATIIDFGGNWVVDPIRKLIGTIRHDEKSEIAIMSKNSLVADRASLERMVIDFVRDRPDPRDHISALDDTTAIANAVREGDLTPVLRAYERDLRAPLAGTIRGDLIRALLIQVQKTKVDVEIAISGINALLKSQELVFG